MKRSDVISLGVGGILGVALVVSLPYWNIRVLSDAWTRVIW